MPMQASGMTVDAFGISIYPTQASEMSIDILYYIIICSDETCFFLVVLQKTSLITAYKNG